MDTTRRRSKPKIKLTEGIQEIIKMEENARRGRNRSNYVLGWGEVVVRCRSLKHEAVLNRVVDKTLAHEGYIFQYSE